MRAHRSAARSAFAAFMPLLYRYRVIMAIAPLAAARSALSENVPLFVT
ncbi:hypothetical protein [Burkholderia oklahomensis]|nr:hypothetical protein [Burkholderia oklahomensis]